MWGEKSRTEKSRDEWRRIEKNPIEKRSVENSRIESLTERVQPKESNVRVQQKESK